MRLLLFVLLILAHAGPRRIAHSRLSLDLPPEFETSDGYTFTNRGRQISIDALSTGNAEVPKGIRPFDFVATAMLKGNYKMLEKKDVSVSGHHGVLFTHDRGGDVQVMLLVDADTSAEVVFAHLPTAVDVSYARTILLTAELKPVTPPPAAPIVVPSTPVPAGWVIKPIPNSAVTIAVPPEFTQHSSRTHGLASPAQEIEISARSISKGRVDLRGRPTTLETVEGDFIQTLAPNATPERLILRSRRASLSSTKIGATKLLTLIIDGATTIEFVRAIIKAPADEPRARATLMTADLGDPDYFGGIPLRFQVDPPLRLAYRSESPAVADFTTGGQRDASPEIRISITTGRRLKTLDDAIDLFEAERNAAKARRRTSFAEVNVNSHRGFKLAGTEGKLTFETYCFEVDNTVVIFDARVEIARAATELTTVHRVLNTLRPND